MTPVKQQVFGQVRHGQVHVKNQVYIYSQVNDQVRYHVNIQTWDQVQGQVRYQVNDQVEDQVLDQVYDHFKSKMQ